MDSDTFNRYRCLLSQALAYSSAKTTDDGMLLNSYNFTCFFGSCNNKLLIQRFNGMDVDYFCIDSVCCKLLSCFKSRCNAKSVCDDGKIFSLAENDALTKLKFIIRSVIDNRNSKTSELSCIPVPDAEAAATIDFASISSEGLATTMPGITLIRDAISSRH